MDDRSVRHTRNISNGSTRSAGDGMEMLSPQSFSEDVPMPVYNHKQPKFVPKEPYKAAVGISKSEQERNKLLKKVDELEREKLHLEQQYKIQVDVNADLKKLLVASLGEDMQTRVQFLTEDKNRLAHEIAFYTSKLQKDILHIDELSIECDVWRTKYLATSLLVTELAQLKAQLMQSCDDFEKALEDSNKERTHLTANLFEAYSLLRETQKQIDPLNAPKKPHPTNAVECSSTLLQLATAFSNKFGVKQNENSEIPSQTPTERDCKRVLSNYKTLTQSMQNKAVIKVDNDMDQQFVSKGVPTCWGCQRCVGVIRQV